MDEAVAEVPENETGASAPPRSFSSQFKLHHEHAWNVSPPEAVAIQRELAPLVKQEPLPAHIETVAGLDVSVRDNRMRAAIVVMQIDELKVVDQATWEGDVFFPYVPGILSFREIPAILPALGRLSVDPDVLMLDAHGLAHTRRFGLACHLGLLLDKPSIGVAKTKLIGTYEEPDTTKGSSSDLRQEADLLGRLVRTRSNVKPVFVSVGHRCTLDDAVGLTLRLATKYRLPEPSRLAHRLSYRGSLE